MPHERYWGDADWQSLLDCAKHIPPHTVPQENGEEDNAIESKLGVAHILCLWPDVTVGQ